MNNFPAQIDIVLPRSKWEKIVIVENNEPLVEIKESDRIKRNLVKKNYKVSFFVRKSVAEKLIEVSKKLPAGINLVIIEGYRSTASQQSEWERIYKDMKSQNPTLDEDKIIQRVSMLVAKPLPLVNHHCGGAIDVSLAYYDNTLLDMGSPYITEIKTKSQSLNIPMFVDSLSSDQQKNRSLLRETMEQVGFVWYPGEWWHYCYGDRMWAVYTNQEKCFYGSIENN